MYILWESEGKTRTKLKSMLNVLMRIKKKEWVITKNKNKTNFIEQTKKEKNEFLEHKEYYLKIKWTKTLFTPPSKN